MPQPLIAPMPPDLILPSGYTIRLTALDLTTGAVVSGVRVTEAVFFVRPVNIGPDEGGDGATPMPLLVPTTET